MNFGVIGQEGKGSRQSILLVNFARFPISGLDRASKYLSKTGVDVFLFKDFFSRSIIYNDRSMAKEFSHNHSFPAYVSILKNDQS